MAITRWLRRHQRAVVPVALATVAGALAVVAATRRPAPSRVHAPDPACDGPTVFWPVDLTVDQVDALCDSPEACADAVTERVHFMEGCYASLDHGCGMRPAHWIFGMLSVALHAFNLMPLTKERSNLYGRLERVAARLPWAGEIDCAELTALHLLWRNLPSAATGAFRALDHAGALDEACAEEPAGAFRAPRGFASFVASEPARLAQMARRDPGSAPLFISGTQDPAEGHLYPFAELRVGTGVTSGPAMIDTGAGAFVVVSRKIAAMLKLRRTYPIAEDKVSPCMYCDFGGVEIAWLDGVRIGGVIVWNVPVLIADMPPDVVLGLPLIEATGGLTIAWSGRYASVRLGPPTACSQPVATWLGYQGRFWIPSSLGPFGSPLLIFDTGVPSAYLLMEDSVPVVPRSWTEVRRDARGPTIAWSAPAMPSPVGDRAATRLVLRGPRGAMHDRLRGGDGYASHLAFAPRTTCIALDPPRIQLGP